MIFLIIYVSLFLTVLAIIGCFLGISKLKESRYNTVYDGTAKIVYTLHDGEKITLNCAIYKVIHKRTNTIRKIYAEHCRGIDYLAIEPWLENKKIIIINE